MTFWPSLMKFHQVILELSRKRKNPDGRTDGQPGNIMPPAPSVRRHKNYNVQIMNLLQREKRNYENRIRFATLQVRGEVSLRPASSPCTYSNDCSSERHKYISQCANVGEIGALWLVALSPCTVYLACSKLTSRASVSLQSHVMSLHWVSAVANIGCVIIDLWLARCTG